MGAAVERTFPDTIEVEGRKRLRGAEHRVIPDRIEAGTFIVAAAVTGGNVTLQGAPCDHLEAFIEAARRVGVGLECGTDTIEVDGSALHDRRLSGDRHRDRAVPGPGDRPPATDLRAPLPGDRACRTSTSRSSRTASSGSARSAGWAPPSSCPTPTTRRSTGPARLVGAEVEIGDLRAGASLILAALAAEGTTTIHGAHHVHRGYENIERKFLDLGASIARSAEGTADTTS